MERIPNYDRHFVSDDAWLFEPVECVFCNNEREARHMVADEFPNNDRMFCNDECRKQWHEENDDADEVANTIPNIKSVRHFPFLRLLAAVRFPKRMDE
jgi:hypothetical protein